jgi:hypothetical protein
MELLARIKVSGALEGKFLVLEERGASEFVIARDTSWKAMRASGERDATEEEIAALRAVMQPADGEG